MPDSNANLNRTQVISLALARLGNTNPSDSENAQALMILNAKVKEIDEDGRWLWAVSNTPSTLTLVASQRSYATGATATTIATNILELERVEIVQGTDLRPLRIVSKTESISSWERQSGNGEPYLVYLEQAPLQSNQKMHFFPTPSAAYSVQYYYRRRLYDFDSPSDNPDFPPGWNLKLVNILAAELAPYYVPLDQVAAHVAFADAAIRKARASNDQTADRVPQQAEYF